MSLATVLKLGHVRTQRNHVDEPKYPNRLVRLTVETDQLPILDGLKILDFSHALAGPYCTMLFASYGATVYKVESPAGDMGRQWGPPFVGDEATYFIGHNRGKYGLSIDLKRHEGVELCQRLAERVDVLVENFRPGTMDRLGLGYAALQARNPRLVYVSISGYGQTGPARDEAAMDLIVQASSGLLSVTGSAGEGEPVRCGYSVVDVTAGMMATIGALMALRAREKTGVGQRVDVAMYDAMISAMTSNFMNYLGSGVVPRPMGTSFAAVVPYRAFRASDRPITMAVGSEKLWSAFCRAIGREDLECHADYATNALRVKNRAALEQILQEVFLHRPAEHWLRSLHALGIPCSLLRDFREVVEDPHSEARDLFPKVACANGSQRVTGNPIKFPNSLPVPLTPAPRLGEHTRLALREVLGLDDGAIDALAKQGIID
jgi:crotonobetainyl-CoA:carnitine CoA-transferase CaiB-like acyl-CoA transferase